MEDNIKETSKSCCSLVSEISPIVSITYYNNSDTCQNNQNTSPSPQSLNYNECLKISNCSNTDTKNCYIKNTTKTCDHGGELTFYSDENCGNWREEISGLNGNGCLNTQDNRIGPQYKNNSIYYSCK